MNLENLYGSQESLVKVFESALRENEPLDVFTRLVAIYQQSQKFDVSMDVCMVVALVGLVPEEDGQGQKFLIKICFWRTLIEF